MSISVAKWTLIFSFCASKITSIFPLYVGQLPHRQLFELFHSLSTAAFCIRIFYRLWHWDELVYHFVMRHRIKSFACNVIFLFCRWRRFHSLPCGFIRFHCTTIHCFGTLLGSNFLLRSHFRDAWLPFARHGWSHRPCQFSPHVFENFFALFVIRIDRVDSSQSSSFVELQFFFCPFLFFSILLSGFTNFRPNFWTYMIWSGSRLNLCQSPSGPQKSFGRSFFQ